MKAYLLAGTFLSGVFLFSSGAYAGCIANQDVKYTANGGSTCVVAGGAHNVQLGWQSYIQAGAGAQSSPGVINFSGDVILNVLPNPATVTKYPNGFGQTALGAFGNSNAAINSNSVVNASNIHINMMDMTKNVEKNGIVAEHGGVVNAKDVVIDILLNSQIFSTTPQGAYGVLVGSSVNAGSGKKDVLSYVNFDSAVINIDSSPSTAIFGTISSGIRAITVNGGGGIVNIADNLTINTKGDYSLGVYVSGQDSQVNLNNTSIKTQGNLSNAIKIGKLRELGTGSGGVVSKGHIDIDTTASSNTASILLIGKNSYFNANEDSSSGLIKTASSAVHFSNTDVYQRAVADGASASFNNTVFSIDETNDASKKATLFKVDSGHTNSTLTLRGKQTYAEAASEGWLIDVQDSSSYSGNAASLTANFYEAAVIKGMVNQGQSKSDLSMNFDGGSRWILSSKLGVTPSNVSKFSQMNLLNSSEVVSFGSEGRTADYTLVGNINSTGGLINLSDGVAGDLLTLQGNYVGSQDAAVQLDTFLGASGSLSDMIVNDGGTITGQTLLRIQNTDASDQGEATEPGHGIKVVNSINSGTTAADAFTLDANAANAYEFEGRTVVGAGAYAYSLYKGGNPNANTPDDDYGDNEIAEDWYLRSQLTDDDPQYTHGVPVYEAYPQVLLALNSLPTLQQRVGNRYWSHAGNIMIEQGADVVGTPQIPVAQTGSFTERSGIWGRIEGQHLKAKPAVTTSDTNYDVDTYKMQAGLDGVLTETENGLLIGGITVHYGHASAKTYSSSGLGKISTDGYGFGGTLTWYGNEGFYVDTQAQFTWYDSDLSARGVNRQTFANGNNGFGYALSAETGKRFMLNDNWSLTPQAQLIYSHVDFNTFTDQYSGVVSLEKGASLQGRIGITADYQNSWYNSKGTINRSYVYGIANLYYEFLDGATVDVSSVRFTSRNDRVWGGVGIGGSYNWDNDKYSVYGEGSVNTSLNHFGDSYAYKGTVGLRMKW